MQREVKKKVRWKLVYHKHENAFKTAMAIISIAIAVLFLVVKEDFSKTPRLVIEQENYSEEAGEENDNPPEDQESEANDSSTKTITVDISGAVVTPGVYELSEGMRIIDLVILAGGLSDDADINAINQASLLHDGSKVYIPVKSESKGDNSIYYGSTYGGNEDLININYADKTELQKIPGVGPVTADRIIEHRRTYGMYASVEELKSVSGIGDKTLEKIKPYITV